MARDGDAKRLPKPMTRLQTGGKEFKECSMSSVADAPLLDVRDLSIIFQQGDTRPSPSTAYPSCRNKGAPHWR